VILAAGLTAAAVVFLLTKPAKDEGAIGYVVEGGTSYAVMPADSTRHEYEMESMEGKEGILFTELTDWFKSLWHGRRLAYTLAVLAVGGFLGSRLVVRLLVAYPPLPEKAVTAAKPPSG
jgi:hypothetical protein